METRPVRIVIVGHVDHGKSTLIGRLFLDTGRMPAEKYEALERAAKARGMQLELANLMDGLQAERDQNITIDTAQIWFDTDQRRYVIIDAPGHREFVKNMVTGAASADAAVLVVDAAEGVREQTRRHAWVLKLLGLTQVVVAVNKMDLAGYRAERFNEVKADVTDFLGRLGIDPLAVVPISAREGDGVAKHASEQMGWYQGVTLLGALDAFELPKPAPDKPLRFVVQDVYRFDERRILAGRVESGTVRVGDKLVFSPPLKASVVRSIERWNSAATTEAGPGESIGIVLQEQIYVDRGAIGSHALRAPAISRDVRASLFSLWGQPIRIGGQFTMKLGTQEVAVEVARIHEVRDSSTLEPRPAGDSAVLDRYDCGEVTLASRRTVAYDRFNTIVPTGRFVLVKDRRIVAGGILTEGEVVDRADQAVASTDIHWSAGRIRAADRFRRNGHPGAVVWLTGLPASGKSTIARSLEEALFARGWQVYVLEGDNVRYGLNSDLDFSPAGRDENIRRIGEVAHLMADAGQIVVAAFVSPMRAQRERARAAMGGQIFMEVFVDTPVGECRRRDPKGLYAKAAAGQITGFTGVDAPYEAPEAPELRIDTLDTTVSEAVDRIVTELQSRFAERAGD